jgi:hypothetical protein
MDQSLGFRVERGGGHYKESYPLQPKCLWLVSKSTIFATIDAIVFHGI